jgi:hypothetical protein
MLPTLHQIASYSAFFRSMLYSTSAATLASSVSAAEPHTSNKLNARMVVRGQGSALNVEQEPARLR